MTTGQQDEAQWVKVAFYGRVPDGEVVTDVNAGEMAQSLARVFGFTAIDALSVARAAEVPPLAELVTDEDVQVALTAYLGTSGLDESMRAALEAYGARLLARHGRTP